MRNVAIVSAILLLSVVRIVSAQVLWQENGIPICTAEGDQGDPHIVGDGAGGAIIAWSAYEYGPVIYAQRVDSNGQVRWTANGVPFTGEYWYEDFDMASDGAGGAIIAFCGGGSEGDIYAQRVDSNGQVRWGSYGIPICTATNQQYKPALVNDGSGGAIIVWEDWRAASGGPSDRDIYAQRVNADGQVQWEENGMPICTADYLQSSPAIVTDAAGSAIIAWSDLRYYQAVDGIYAQRISYDGSIQWQTDGVEILDWGGWNINMASDDQSGSVIIWLDEREGIYVQRVDMDGQVQYQEDGILICPTTYLWSSNKPPIVSDGLGNTIISWLDSRWGFPTNFAQRMDLQGNMLWNPDGIGVRQGEDASPVVCSDGAGGAIFAMDGIPGAVFVQHVDANGATLWGTTGITLYTSVDGSPTSPAITSDGADGAIIVWTDNRSGNFDIYAQRVNGHPSAPSVIYVPDDYLTIQAAMDAASAGDTIIVRDGTYTENVDVNKDHLTIKSENGADSTIVQAANPDDDVFEIIAGYVNIDGFTIKAASERSGIYLDGADYCEISNNKLSSNNYGITTRTYSSSEGNVIVDNICENNDRGIFVSYGSSSNSVTHNICKNNNVGIFLAGGNNVITGNTFENNTRGILLYYSDGDNTLTENIMLGNEYNFCIYGFDLYQYIQTIDASNKVDGKPIYYLVGEQDKQVPSDAGYVAIVNSTNITVKNLTLINNGEGVLLAYSTNSRVDNINTISNYYGIRLHRSSHNTIIDNTVSNNYHGIYLYYASYGIPSCTNNVVTNNNISNNEHGITIWDYAMDNTIISNNISNNECGIYVRHFSGMNHIYLNNSMNNVRNVRCYASDKIIWNSPDEITYTYNDSTHTNYLGNYWSDYEGNDANGDGIGDTPYSINPDNDNYPLIEPFDNYGMLTLVSPPNSSHISSARTFRWTRVQDALYYHLVVARDSTFSDIIWNQPSILGDQTSILYNGSTLLETGQTYYWKMRFQDRDLNWSDWTAAWSFTKDAGGSPLAAPDLNMPADGSSVALPETFSWEAVSGVERYLVQIAPEITFSSVLWEGQSKVTQITVPGGISGISDGSTYYWHTAGIDTGRNVGDFSDAYSFIKVASVSPPSAPTLVQPAEGDTVRSQTVTFSWSSSGATSYTLRYSVASGFPSASDSTWTVRGITDTTYSVHLPPATTTIYWKMTASNSAGTSGWSSDRSFYYHVPPSEQVTSAVIDLPRHGIHVPVGANVGGHAYFTGSYNGTISGAWYVNGASFSSFTAEMTPSEGAEIEISGLPTDIAGEDTLQVCVASPNSVYSNTVVYTVYVPEVSNAAQLQLRATPSAIPADGDSSCTITAVVQDSAGHTVESDNGREITFSVSGEGTLPSPPTATTVNGIATITLTSTTTPDDSVMVAATAGGLAGDRVRVFCYDAEYKTYRLRVLAYADRLEHLKLDIYDPPFDISVPSYDVQGVRDFVATRIDTGILPIF